MRTLDLIKRSYRNLKQSKVRTILTAMAIAVGATTICLALAAGNGGRDFIDQAVSGVGFNVRDIDVYAYIRYEYGEEGTRIDTSNLLCAAQISQIKSLDNVESVNGGEAYNDETPGCYLSLTVRVNNEDNLHSVMAAINQALPDSITESQKESRENLYNVINVAQWALAGFGALAILASVFGIINTQYISVLERTREIGLMKALGMKRKDISRIFRYEAAWIGFLGGAIGVFVAWLITLLNPIINRALDLEDGVRLLQINWVQAGVLVLSLMIVAVLSGFIPARKAAKLDPIEALRTE